MDFITLQEKAKKLTQKTIDISKKGFKKTKAYSKSTLALTDNYIKNKLNNSSLILKKKTDFLNCIQSSKNTIFTDKKTGEKKESLKQSFIIFLHKENEFSESILYKIPIIYTKAYAQNMQFGIVFGDIKGIKKEDYEVTILPSLILFENTQVKKVISGEENIQKVVNALSLDINKAINEL